MTEPSDGTAAFGPGELTIGAAGSDLDVSCLVNSFTISATKDQGDDQTKLCGTVRPGRITYAYEAAGNLDLDATDPAGLFALSQAVPGSQQPFSFTPNHAGPSASGVLILDPMDYGGDEYGATMTSDVTWALVGRPVYQWPGDAPVTAVDPAADLADA